MSLQSDRELTENSRIRELTENSQITRDLIGGSLIRIGNYTHLLITDKIAETKLKLSGDQVKIVWFLFESLGS